MKSSRRLSRALLAMVLAVSMVLAAVPAYGPRPAGAEGNIQVKVRIEGISETHVNRMVEVPDGSDALDAAVKAVNDSGKTCLVKNVAWGDYLSSVEADVEGAFGGWDGWLYTVIRNGAVDPASANVGAASYLLSDGDSVLFYYGGVVWPTPATGLRREDCAVQGKTRIRLVDLGTGDGIEGATVRLGASSAVTDAEGRALLDLGNDGECVITAEKTDPAGVPPGAPLIARPEPLKLWAEGGDSYPLGLDAPTIGSTSYNPQTRAMSVAGSAHQAAEVVGRVLDWGAVVSETSAQVPSGQYTLTFPSIPGGSYSISVFARLADGTRSTPATKNVSVSPNTYLSDALLSESVNLAKAYLKGQQQADGNLGSWPAIELAAAGESIPQNHLDYFISKLGEPGYLARTTDYARSVLEACACGADPSNIAGKDLVADITSRQDQNGHFGVAGEETWVNSHVWSILALKRASTPIPNPNPAREWLLSAGNADKGWGFVSGVSSSPDMTAQVIRALLALGEPADSAAIRGAIDFLATKQAASGGFLDDSWGPAEDANVYSTAEAVRALCEAGVNPLEKSWLKPGGDMLSYLAGCQASTGQVKSVKGTADFVGAVTAFSKAGFSVAGSGGGKQDGGGGNNPPSTLRVSVEVWGRGRETMRKRTTVGISSSDPTPLAALRKTGAQLIVRDGGYVAGIDGLCESGASGWKYAVNRRVPALGCAEYILRDGDAIVWFWALDYRDTGGFEDDIAGPSLPPLPPKPEIASSQAQRREEIRQAAARELERLRAGVPERPDAYLELSAGCVTPDTISDETPAPGGSPAVASMTHDEIAYWRAALERNIVAESAETAAGAAATIGDETGEFEIALAANSFAGRQTLSVVEVPATGAPGRAIPRTHKAITPLYSVTAGETSLGAHARISIRVIPPENCPAKDLVMARYDAATQRWIPLQSVYDPANGMVTGVSTTLGSFAVFQRTAPVVSFSDVSETNCAWAKEAVEVLATSGCVSGVSPSLFEPARNVTRAEFVKMLSLLMGIEPLENRAAPFVDVSGNEWHAGYLSAAVASGLVMGGADGLFRPDDPISRQEVSILLARSVNVGEAPGGTAQGDVSGFSDAEEIPRWAREAASIVTGLGIVKGLPDGSFRPGAATTRAEAAVMLARLLLVPGRR